MPLGRFIAGFYWMSIPSALQVAWFYVTPLCVYRVWIRSLGCFLIVIITSLYLNFMDTLRLLIMFLLLMSSITLSLVL